MSNHSSPSAWTRGPITLVLVLLCTTSFLVGAVSRSAVLRGDVIEGRELRLVDGEDRVRARLSIRPDGGAGLALYDRDDIERAWFGLSLPGGDFDVDESVEIVLRGGGDDRRIVLAQQILSGGDELGSLVMSDGQAQPAAALRSGREGRRGPQLEVGRDDCRFAVDPSLRTLTMANLDLDEETGSRRGDEAFSVRLGGASAEDLSSVSLTRQGARVETSLREWGEARILLVDDDGERQVVSRGE